MKTGRHNDEEAGELLVLAWFLFSVSLSGLFFCISLKCSCRRDVREHLPLTASGSHVAPAAGPSVLRYVLSRSPRCASCFWYWCRWSLLSDRPPTTSKEESIIFLNQSTAITIKYPSQYSLSVCCRWRPARSRRSAARTAACSETLGLPECWIRSLECLWSVLPRDTDLHRRLPSSRPTQ